MMREWQKRLLPLPLAIFMGGAPVPPRVTTPPSVSFQARTHDGNVLTTYTFASQALGTAATGRRIAVSVHPTMDSGTVPTISSVTVAGQAASQRVAVASTRARSEIWIATVNTGTSGTIEVVLSGDADRCSIGVWAIYDLAADTARDTGTATADPANVNVDVLVGDILLVAACETGGATTATPTGYTERADNATSFGSDTQGDAVISTAATPRTVTVDWLAAGGFMAAVSLVLR